MECKLHTVGANCSFSFYLIRLRLRPMNQAVKSLIPAIAAFVKERESYLSKTKLLKLLYLFDIEYYRIHRETFTGFQWKFFHLGPWTNELDPLLDELTASVDLVARPNLKPEFDSKNYEASEEHDTGSLFTSHQDKGALESVLYTWAERSTSEILDYVYFRTEPMERGIRNAPLDFSTIPTQAPEKYTKPTSSTPSSEIARLRREFRERMARLKNREQERFDFTPPRYDEEFLQAIGKLDQASS